MASDWTMERVAKLDRDEIEQLRANALGLGEHEVAAICEKALVHSPKRRTTPAAKQAKAQRLISRSAAFEARGVYLDDARTSWGGVRKSDGAVVMGLWAAAVKSRDGGCGCLLWAPNVDGSRPWSDSASGQERLKHCRLVMDGAAAEGLLVFGQALSIGAIGLISNRPKNTEILVESIAGFGFSFLILISIWFRYTEVLSVIRVEMTWTRARNTTLLASLTQSK